MKKIMLVGRGKEVVSIPRDHWEQQLDQVPGRMRIRLGFMTRQHHLVRYFVVRMLPRIGEPISPEIIASKLALALNTVQSILNDLEERLFFLVRDERGAVNWAYPFTVEETRHRLRFSSGEEVYAA